MAVLDDVVVISGCRTPVGKFQGSLSDLSAPQLGAIVVREAVKRSGLEPQQVDECIMGNVVSAGLGQNPARQADGLDAHDAVIIRAVALDGEHQGGGRQRRPGRLVVGDDGLGARRRRGQ